jgi:DNA polymerase-4
MTTNRESNLAFNPAASTIMHIDLNSCFATIEQQATPHLRGRPIAVAAYVSPGGCILAASVEAKKFGVATGVRVKEGKELCPDLFVMPADPNKYRSVHMKLRRLLSDYTDDFYPKSIDEFVLNLDGYPSLLASSMQQVGGEIKTRIKSEIGDWLTVSVGIGPSRFMAKTASNLKKPDGLEEINKANFVRVYERLGLRDLHGINRRNEIRLNGVGIFSVIDFYKSELWRLRAAFKSILSYYWHVRLRGWEIDAVEFGRKTFGNSYALPYSEGSREELLPIMQKLTEKTGTRLRAAGYKARGIYVSMGFRDRTFWHKSRKLPRTIFDSRDIFKEAARVLGYCPEIRPVHTLSISCFALSKSRASQLDLFEDIEKKEKLTKAQDAINDTWGTFAIAPTRMLTALDKVPDRIAFGGVKEIEEKILT